MMYEEIVGDLFTEDTKKYVLAHTVSVDCTMNAGIARTFISKYPGMRSYCKVNKPNIGKVIMYERVYNLFTKEKHWHKPTLGSIHSALVSLREDMLVNGNRYLAIPKIGSGLDKQPWSLVKQDIQNVFADTNIHIRVYEYQG